MIPRGVTHLLVGWITGLMIVYRFDLPIYSVTFYMIGSLWPDTDHRKSILGRWIPLWLWFHPHRRNLLHSLWGAILFSFIWLPVSLVGSMLFFLGYVGHLVLDLFNRTGVPLWYPNPHMVTLGSSKGGIMELLLAIGFYMMMVALLS